jgi:NAD(P)-dependent dehydrogenase (short-subunit alcohol dehydrogenase family)
VTLTMVTGASGGIGSAVVRRLRQRGDEVIAVGRDAEKLKQLDARPVVVDLSRPAHLGPAVDALALTELDALVHCAGVIELGPVADTPHQVWTEHLTVNLVAPAELTRGCLPALRRAKGQVVFVNFHDGHPGAPGWAAYAASKQGLRALADTLREEEDRNGVGVTSLYPACTATEMQRRLREGHGRRYRPEAYVRPETVAELICQALSVPADARVTELTVTMSSLRAAR